MRVHLDHNATTPLRPEARAELVAVLDRLAGNPSSVHAGGRHARELLDDARERCASALGVAEDEVLFCSGGTEANAWAIAGAGDPRGPLVTTAAEHSSVLESARAAAAVGREVRVVGVGPEGAPDQDELVRAAQGAALVSVAAANNEVGACCDLAELVRRLESRAPRPLVHTDAVQALGRVPVEPRAWGVDLASLSAHKVGGPVGVGILFRRAGVPLAPLLRGGGQEAGLRAGTESVAAIAAAARAVELAVAEREAYAARTRELARELFAGLRAAVPGARLLGPPLDAPLRLPNTLVVALPGADGRTLVARLDLEGLEVSAGSACASGSLEPSHVLLAMGCSEEVARAGLRLSLGRTTTSQDIHNAVEIVRRTFGKPR